MSAGIELTDGLPGTPGDYFGRPTRRLEGAHCWVEVLAEGGPRVLRFGRRGGPNVFAETPKATWDAGHGTYELLGGHRFWFAPETADCSVPDAAGLALTTLPGAPGPAVRLVGAVEAPTGLRKTIEVRLDADTAAMSLRHVLANEGSRTLEIAPWPVTQLRLGGMAVAPLPPGDEEPSSRPNQLVVLWPYASGSDDRIEIGDHRLTVFARPAKPMKVGCLSATGTAGYLLDGLLVMLRFTPARGSVHPDLGCNLEIYSDERTIELETIGPLVSLAPGDSVTHDERWEISEVGEDLDAAAVEALLRGLAEE